MFEGFIAEQKQNSCSRRDGVRAVRKPGCVTLGRLPRAQPRGWLLAEILRIGNVPQRCRYDHTRGSVDT
jgi:hypothetical protein